ncbi:MAG: acetolactate synthase small subunit [Ardenticatenia bacterium]|nr:acetolactate synthase small subunit [Ardenticatenia bacterium]
MKHTIVAWMEDKPGVLNRVASLFRRRNFNIESLTVGHSEAPGISRMTFVVEGDERQIQQVQAQLFKLINVTAVQDVTHIPSVERELALIKVNATGADRSEIIQLVDIYRATIVGVEVDSLIIQIGGPTDRIESLTNLLRNFGIREMVRTGSVAMVRGNGFAPVEQHNGVS